MEMRTSLLAVIASVVLLGCNTPAGRDSPSAARGEQPNALGRPTPQKAVDTPYSVYFVGKAAPLDATTDNCSGSLCPVEVDVDDNCNVTTTAVLNLMGVPPNPRKILFAIKDNYQNHIFPPLGSSPPALVVQPDASGNPDPAFGTPLIQGQLMWVLFYNAHPRLSHYYSLNVIKTNGDKCPTYDPWVIE